MEGNPENKQPPLPPKPPIRQQFVNINLPSIYVNTFLVNISASDVVVTLMLNGQPFQIVNMSYNTAKGLAEALTEAVKKYEIETSTKVLNAKEAATFLKKQ